MKFNESLAHIFCGVKAMDCSSTFIGIGLGATELNPAGVSVWTLFIIPITALILIHITYELFPNSKLYSIVMGVIIVAILLGVINNIYQLTTI